MEIVYLDGYKISWSLKEIEILNTYSDMFKNKLDKLVNTIDKLNESFSTPRCKI